MVLPFLGLPIVFLGQKQFATCPVTVQIAPGPGPTLSLLSGGDVL